MKILIISFFIFLACSKQEIPLLEKTSIQNSDREIDKIAYALGAQYGRAVTDLNLDQKAEWAFIEGVEDYFNDQLKMRSEEVSIHSGKVDRIIQENRARSADMAKQEGEAFVDDLMSKDSSYQKSESGLVYKIAKKGKHYSVDPDKTFINMSYRAFHLNGEKFEQTIVKQPKELPYRGLLKAWQIAFQIAGTDSAITIIAPPELTYGNAGASPLIKPGEYLKFQIRFYEANEK